MMVPPTCHKYGVSQRAEIRTYSVLSVVHPKFVRSTCPLRALHHHRFERHLSPLFLFASSFQPPCQFDDGPNIRAFIYPGPFTHRKQEARRFRLPLPLFLAARTYRRPFLSIRHQAPRGNRTTLCDRYQVLYQYPFSFATPTNDKQHPTPDTRQNQIQVDNSVQYGDPTLRVA